jgi:hypothetical protein
VLYAVLVVPLLQWIVGQVTGPRRSAGAEWAQQWRAWDTGPLWFALVLLLFCLAVAACHQLRPVPQASLAARPGLLMASAAGIALLSYLLRIRFRIDTFQIGAAHLWQWGQCAGMFTLGVLLGRPGLDAVDRRSLRLCRVGLGAGLVAILALLAAAGSDLDPLGGGPGWQSALVATVEGVVCVSGTVVADSIRRRHHPLIQRLSRPSYGAYVAQAPVIVGIALCLRNVPLPPTAKLILLLPAAVTSCYMLAAAAHHARAARRRDPRPDTATPKPVTGRAYRPDA